MDSKDRPLPSVPAVISSRSTSIRPVALDAGIGRPSAEAPQGSVNLLRVACRAVTRHWWQILGIWILATGALIFLINANIKPTYQAVSWLRVEPSRRDLFGTGSGGESFEPYLETQVQMITSPKVLTDAAADPALVKLQFLPVIDAESELRRKLVVMLIPKSYLIRVAMTLPSSENAAAAVKAVVNAYIKSALDYSEDSSRLQIHNLQQYQLELEGLAAGKREEWLTLAGKSNVDLENVAPLLTAQGANGLPMPVRNRVTMDEYKRVRDELFKLRIALSEAEAVLSIRESTAQALSRGGASAEADPQQAKLRIEYSLRADPEVAAMLQKLEQADHKYNGVRRVTRDRKDPALLAAFRDLKDLGAKYQDLIDAKREMVASGASQLDVNSKTTDGSLAQARETVHKLKAQQKHYQTLLSGIEVTNRQEGSDAVRIALVREEIAGLGQLQTAVMRRLEQLKLDSRGEARITLVSEAKPSFIPETDNRSKYMMFTPAGVLGVLLGLFVLLELKIGRVSDVDDLSRQIPVEVFAIPPLPGPRLESGHRGAREREARLQEFLQTLDHLRVALCGDQPPSGVGRCLMITSATAGEGKTTLIAQFAACCAKAGISTLVIDGDLRRATLSRILNEEATPGLSDVLQGDLDLEAAPVALPDAGFHFLAAGSAGRDPSWLLKNQRIGEILTRYRQVFDLVLIDTPPVLPVPDALTIGRWVDGAVLTTRFDVSRFSLVNQARKRISAAGIPLLKTVVNGVRSSRFSYDQSGYRYGYGYGYDDRNGGYGDSSRLADSSTAPAPNPSA